MKKGRTLGEEEESCYLPGGDDVEKGSRDVPLQSLEQKLEHSNPPWIIH